MKASLLLLLIALLVLVLGYPAGVKYGGAASWAWLPPTTSAVLAIAAVVLSRRSATVRPAGRSGLLALGTLIAAVSLALLAWVLVQR